MAKLRMAHASTHGARKPPGQKQIFTHGRFLEVGQKQKTDRKERPTVGNNNGQLCIANANLFGAHKAAWAKTSI